MFRSWSGVSGFVVGVAMTVGLLLSPHLLPWPALYGAGFGWPPLSLALAAAGAALSLAAALWAGGRLLIGAASWKEPRLILGALLIAFVANALFCLLVELFSLAAGARALVALLGVPIIYGNLGAVLGRTSLAESMKSIFTGALATMGAGFIVAAIIKGW
jgi:hypothetical protein